MKQIIHNAKEIIGNTQLMETHNYMKAVQIENATILAKLEYLNPAGSVKDRIAIAMIEDAEKKVN